VYRGEENETDIWITEGAEPIMRPLEAVFDRFKPYFRFRSPFWSPLEIAGLVWLLWIKAGAV
jgi:hypothetical protein